MRPRAPAAALGLGPLQEAWAHAKFVYRVRTYASHKCMRLRAFWNQESRLKAASNGNLSHVTIMLWGYTWEIWPEGWINIFCASTPGSELGPCRMPFPFGGAGLPIDKMLDFGFQCVLKKYRVGQQL